MKVMRMIKRIVLIACIVMYSQSAYPDFLSLEITSPDSVEIFSETFSTVDELIDATEQRNISLAGYNQNSEATIAILLGNTQATISYESDSTGCIKSRK